jgi:hypothetical protein
MSWNSTKIKSLDMILHFGKHKGKSIQWLLDNDLEYIKWAISTKKPVLVFTKVIKPKVIQYNLFI